ncbi:MAG: hypothetical protein LBJ80_03985 [Rickettsiales bacterium]|jgi:hypothetical protein|nr:hypothetical protein [Rickettsiales bacterium]MDR1261549.1 hypothetical protein [Rickettsiales bacterium]
MSKEIVGALKAQTEESEYSYLRAAKEKSKQDWNSSYNITYNYLKTEEPKLIVNGQEITKEFIEELCSKHENLIPKDKNGKRNYRLFLKAVFAEIFWNACERIPNSSIIEELITYYNRSGYMEFFSFQDQAPLGTCSLKVQNFFFRERIYMSCDDPNCLKFNFSTNKVIHDDHKGFICDLHNSVEFKLKCKDGNVTYEEGKVSLTIPGKLKNYKVDDKNLFDIIVEYFQRACEKLGFKFETKIEHSLGKPLKVIDEPGVVEGFSPRVNNPR